MGKGLLQWNLLRFLASSLCWRGMGAIYRGQMDRVVWGPYLDPVRAVWIRNSPLWRLGIHKGVLVLGSARALRQGVNRSSTLSHPIFLVSGKGGVDTSSWTSGVGALSSLGALLLLSPLGTTNGHHQERQHNECTPQY